VHSLPTAITSTAGAGAAGRLKDGELDPLLSPEEFRKLQLEVERLGTCRIQEFDSDDA
jgi:hypothetical protein